MGKNKFSTNIAKIALQKYISSWKEEKRQWVMNVWYIVKNNTCIILNDYLVELYALLLWQIHSDKIMCYVPFKYLQKKY